MTMAARSALNVYGTGRRKEAVARVFMRAGSGRITINGRELPEYFRRASLVQLLRAPLEAVNAGDLFDFKITVDGGGPTGQAGAVRHGIARALNRHNPEWRPTLKRAGFLTRDARTKERKKYGQKGARARFQFSKR
jgi:small subunit ribosomal protein S9